MIDNPSPNYGSRRGGVSPHVIVLHYTAMRSADAALERLCDPKSEVSAHYLIAADGRIWRLVDEACRAWHAGLGSWRGWEDMNSRSIGVELDNDGASPFPEPQMRALERLLRDLMTRHAIPAHDVIGHSDMAPGRKQDPGPQFDWPRLAAAGLASRSGDGEAPRIPDPKLFRRIARDAGYTADVDDDTLLAAVRLRHRPTASGPLAPEDFPPLGNAGFWT